MIKTLIVKKSTTQVYHKQDIICASKKMGVKQGE